MRILHLLNHAQNVGNGIVNVAIDLACLQSQSGHQVAIAAGQTVVCKGPNLQSSTLQDSNLQDSTLQNVTLQSSNHKDYRALLARYGVQYCALEQKRTLNGLRLASMHYRQLIQSFQPDIVHVHMMTGLVLAKVLRLGSDYRLISTVHNEFQRSVWLMGLADGVIAVSQAVATAMQKRGIPSHKLWAIPNATIGSPRQQPLASYEPLPLKRPAITTVAGLSHRKGIDLLIEAFNQVATTLTTAHLYIVGEGPIRAFLEAKIQESPVSERIHLEGFQREPQRYLRATDVFVLASRKEPFGLVLSEAREAGCAILATRVDGIPEALDEGSAGWLVKPDDAAVIARALNQLLSDPLCLTYWRQRSNKNLEHLNVERMHQETLALYQAVLKHKSSPQDMADLNVHTIHR